MKTLFICLLASIPFIGHADEITFRGAGTYRNVKIVDTIGTRIRFLVFKDNLVDTLTAPCSMVDSINTCAAIGDSRYRYQFWEKPPDWVTVSRGRVPEAEESTSYVSSVPFAFSIQTMPSFPNAIPVHEKITHPHMALAMPFAISSGFSGIIAIAAAPGADEKTRASLYGLGAAYVGLSVYFFSVAFQQEHWVVYSNGMEVRVSYGL